FAKVANSLKVVPATIMLLASAVAGHAATDVVRFASSGTFVVPQGVKFVTVVGCGGGGAGGGGGGSNSTIESNAGGGGAGAPVLTTTITVAAGQSVSVVIGSGGSPGSAGAGAPNGLSSGGRGGNGTESRFGDFIFPAAQGGGGGDANGAPNIPNPTPGAGGTLSLIQGDGVSSILAA